MERRRGALFWRVFCSQHGRGLGLWQGLIDRINQSFFVHAAVTAQPDALGQITQLGDGPATEIGEAAAA